MSLIVIIEEGPLEDHGSVVTFEGVDDGGNLVTFAVDHRVAQDLIGHQELVGEVRCSVEGWQILSVIPS